MSAMVADGARLDGKEPLTSRVWKPMGLVWALFDDGMQVELRGFADSIPRRWPELLRHMHAGGESRDWPHWRDRDFYQFPTSQARRGDG